MPSLRPLHGLDSYATATKLSVDTIGIVTLPSDGAEHFVLAALKFTLKYGQYEVHVFRSEPGTWTRYVLLDAKLNAHGMALGPEKVINLGGGKIGWVDLWQGILMCSVVDENPVLSFIPLPTLLPANQAEFNQNGFTNGRPFRDVVVVCSTADDGGAIIGCVEGEICTRRVAVETPDVSGAEVLSDSELWLHLIAAGQEDCVEYLGLRIITWARPVSSDFWHRSYLLHVDEILADSRPSHSTSDIMSADNLNNLTLKELITCFPTMSMVDGDAVYLLCKGQLEDQKAWVVTVDTRNKTALELVPFSSRGSYFSGMNFTPCALSKYL
uniref:Uncharacterized protein n=1 Tax=Avena sativa TaxID=4498 RepID=A0ACD6ABT4_AVESA